MYFFKTKLKDEYLDGRTITYIAKKIGITKHYVTNILNGKKHCSKLVAYVMVKVVNQEAEINDYFERK